MAITPGQLINRAYRLAAGMGQDPHAALSIDNVWAFEEAFPLALSEAVEEIGDSSDEIEHYRRSFALTLVDGSIALPEDVMHRFLDRSVLQVTGEEDIPASFCSRYEEFLRPAHAEVFHYYTTRDNALKVRIAGGEPAVYDGAVTLTAVAVPAIPSTLASTMTIPEDLADRTVEILARMIAGRPSE
jgi:hypothetical protein